MIQVSLCGCLKRHIDTALKGKAFSDLIARHYQKYPECRKKAENDPVWKARKEPMTRLLDGDLLVCKCDKKTPYTDPETGEPLCPECAEKEMPK